MKDYMEWSREYAREADEITKLIERERARDVTCGESREVRTRIKILRDIQLELRETAFELKVKAERLQKK